MRLTQINLKFAGIAIFSVAWSKMPGSSFDRQILA
jgi:hypothetical protein